MLKPVREQLLVRKLAKEAEKKTASGLVISSTFDHEIFTRAVIVAMGEGEPSPYTHQLIKIPELDIGNTILYPTSMGLDVESDDEVLTLVNYKSVVAIEV